MSAIGGFLETFDCWNMAPVKIDDSTVHLYGADLVAVRFVFREITESCLYRVVGSFRPQMIFPSTNGVNEVCGNKRTHVFKD